MQKDPDFYKGNADAWDQLVLILAGVQFDLIQEADENTQEAWKILVSKYQIRMKKQKVLLMSLWSGIHVRWMKLIMTRMYGFLGCTGSIRNSRKSTLIMRRMKNV